MTNEYKGYLISSDGTYGLKEVKLSGKGSVPLSLRGKFTTAGAAQRTIDLYLDEKNSKGE